MRPTPLLLVALATPALAGPAAPQASLVLDGPDAVVLGAPVTFTVSNTPQWGGGGLFIDDGLAGGPVACPPPLLGACLDLDGPVALLGAGRYHNDRTSTYRVIPPLGAPMRTYALQAAGVAGGVPVVSNVHPLDVIDPCTTTYETWPRDAQPGIQHDTWPTFTFDDNVATMWSYALFDDMTPVPVEVIAGGVPGRSEATLAPYAPLEPDTTYTLVARSPCGVFHTSTFITMGETFPGTDLLGHGFVLELDNITVSNLSVLGLLPEDLMGNDGVMAFEFASVDAFGATAVVHNRRLTAPGGPPDLTAPLHDFFAAVDVAPYVLILARNIAPVTSPFEVQARIDFEWDPVTELPKEGTIRAVIGADLSDTSSPGPDSCPANEGPGCLNFVVEGLSASPLPSTLDP